MIRPNLATAFHEREGCTSTRPSGLDARSSQLQLESPRFLDELALSLLLYLRVLQHPLRNHLASSRHGQLRSDQRFGIDCALGLYGRPGSGIVGERLSNPATLREAQEFCPHSLRSHRVVHRRVGHFSAL
jgi:hypothetical protein